MIKRMNNLPNNGDTSTQKTTPIGSFSKEVDIGRSGGTESPIRDLGKEMDLPKEVVAAGVKASPTTIPIPPPVKNLGVKAAGTNIPASSTPSTKLPLSDVQIAEGLHTDIASSIRWLAEWCRYKLKKIGLIQ